MRIQLFIPFLLLLLSQDCATRRKDSSSASKGEEKKAEAEKTIAAPDVSMDSYKLGTLQIARLISNSHQGSEMYYKYKICNESNDCSVQGSLVWGYFLFPTLPEGKYTVKVSSCLQTFNPPTPEVCKNEVELPYTQVRNPQDELYTMVKELLDISQKIKSKSERIHELMKTYESSAPESTTPAAVTFDQAVQTQLDYGPVVTAEAINSSEVANIAEDAQVMAPSASTPAAESQAQGEAAQDKSASNNAFGGAILVSLGSPLILLGVVVGGGSWYLKVTAPKVIDETKEMVDEEIENAKRAADKKINSAKKFADKKIEEAQKLADKKIDEGKALLDKKIDTAKSAIDQKASELRGQIDENIRIMGNKLNPEILKTEKAIQDAISQIVEDSAHTVRSLSHSFQGYSQEMKFADLQKKFYTDLKEVPSKIPEHRIFTAQGRTFIVETDSQMKVYELNKGAVESSLTSKLKLGAGSMNFVLTEEQYNQLTYTEKEDFEQKNDKWVLKEDLEINNARSKFFTHDGKIYNKINAYSASTVPKLSVETMAVLAPLYSSDDVNYGKGIVLIDEYGRLVKPPTAWLLEGVNWPKNVGPWGSPKYVMKPFDYKAYGLTKETAVFSKGSEIDSIKTIEMPQSWMSYAISFKTDPFISIEVPIRHAELQSQIALRENLRKATEIVGDTKTSAQKTMKSSTQKAQTTVKKMTEDYAIEGKKLTDEYATEGKKITEGYSRQGQAFADDAYIQGRSLTEQYRNQAKEYTDVYSKKGKSLASKYSSTGMKAGGGMAFIGLLTVGGGLAVNYALASDPKAILLSELAAIEKEIAELNASRLYKYKFNIVPWLTARNFPVDDGEWIHHLQ